jgi:hypothetical protein
MANEFLIGFDTDPMFVQNPPPQYRDLGLVYCPVGIRVNSVSFPGPGWCDFAGVLLLRWCCEVWRLSGGESRAARLIFFDTPSEIWVRRTATRRWKVSCVVREANRRTVTTEALCIPERIEAVLLSASQRFLAGVRRAGVWGRDCEQLASFLSDSQTYLTNSPPQP